MHMSSKKSLAIAVAALSAATLSTQSLAQANYLLEEVIVTAQKREQRLQDVPVSVNVVGGEEIAESGISNLEELSGQVPNLTINNGPLGAQIFIRGLGSTANQGFEQSVGLFIDGVYAGRSRQFQAAFLDIESVEVLRGPQGTLFGKNTIAGAMTLTSAKPTETLEASLKTTYEPHYDSYTAEGKVSGPLTESLMGRLAVSQSESDGYMDNRAQDSKGPSSRTTVVRGSLLWEPTKDLDVLAKYENGYNRTNGSNYTVDEAGPWAGYLSSFDAGFNTTDLGERSTSTPESLDTNSESFTLNVNYRLGEYQLTSITGYSEYQYQDVVDADQTAIDSINLLLNQDFDQVSQEIRLTSPLGSELDFIAGLFYQTTNLNHSRRANLSLAAYGGLDPMLGLMPQLAGTTQFDQESESYAAFGSVTWHVSDDLHLTGGLRYTVEDKEATRDLIYTDYSSSTPLAEIVNPTAPLIPGLGVNQYMIAVGGLHTVGLYEHEVEGDRSAENLSPAIKVQYDLSDDVMLYLSASKAFKSGGYDESGSQGDEPGEYAYSATPFGFDEEEALAFEIGTKMTLLEGAAKLNIALFRTEYDDLQVSSFQGDVFTVGNAAEAISQGVEVDGTVRLSENLFLNASMAYLDASYDKFENASCTVTQLAVTPGDCSQDLSGRELANAPEWSGNIALDHMLSLGDSLQLRSHVSVVYTDEKYLAADLDTHSIEEDHTILNARVALSDNDGSWELALVSKNLTNEDVRSWSNDAFFLSGAQFSYVEPPRTVAVQFNLNY